MRMKPKKNVKKGKKKSVSASLAVAPTKLGGARASLSRLRSLSLMTTETLIPWSLSTRILTRCHRERWMSMICHLSKYASIVIMTSMRKSRGSSKQINSISWMRAPMLFLETSILSCVVLKNGSSNNRKFKSQKSGSGDGCWARMRSHVGNQGIRFTLKTSGSRNGSMGQQTLMIRELISCSEITQLAGNWRLTNFCCSEICAGQRSGHILITFTNSHIWTKCWWTTIFISATCQLVRKSS